MAEAIKEKLRLLTNHNNIAIVSRGDAAIKAALRLFARILIPAEGGWISYKKLAKTYDEVACDEAKINLIDLEKKLRTRQYQAILYQQPGGYFADQPVQEIYQLAKMYGCLVIIDVSGAIGTDSNLGSYADILVGSFGKWKLIDAGKGGFLSCKDNHLFQKISYWELTDETVLNQIAEKIDSLKARCEFLNHQREQIIGELKSFHIIHPQDKGLVVVVAFATNGEKESIINYCKSKNLPWTECPRYIRVNKPAICMEVKRL